MRFLKDAYKISEEGLDGDKHVYSFISVGGQRITKVVTFYPLKHHKEVWYIVGFGNKKIIGNDTVIDEHDTFNNNDYPKVLATVFNCIILFLNANPDSQVICFGNADYKERIYRRKINANFKFLRRDFNFRGVYINNKIIEIDKSETIIKRYKKVQRRMVIREIVLDNGEIIIDKTEPYAINRSKSYDSFMISVKY